MIRPGLVSVTFRQLEAREIVDLVAQAGLEGIEWGGDIHVPPGDFAQAREVSRITRDAGLAVASYGSYYRLDGNDFETVLETAVALEAPNIRIWAGRTGSDETPPEGWAAAVADGRRIAQLAADAGITLSFEFHQGTLCDTAQTTLALLNEIGSESFRTYWQPLPGQDLQVLVPHLSNLHVFHWSPEGRHPLADGEAAWHRYLDAVAPDKDRWALLEFVLNDSPEQFLRDAETLRQWLAMPVGGQGADGQ